ncbi:transcriptional regulator, TetR family protein [Oceanicola granulosus HTCC2516]|uniref:Transcriptional regulator, TetR family protein n=1 Tax=Oceanicola granulosus (strain ATCC BAA-861 / DSM 15982 / KCTC 12143 / HTCC2516) TaxID=314256 RepID=Q2CH12_OCEGH|nr:TetR/AcrR family transcriptional regulator [Oceanicola granulosus]EAR51999.1 transcriptional regulator, TetR family protein [Oceanicola granulosus HTCC2516]
MKRKRAEDEERTRSRIAQAAVDLHGSIGPALTTISAVAERAGVRRATVYRHFPDEAALFQACSSRWLSQSPLPAIDTLNDIDDGEARLRAALDLVYAYYRPNARMLSNVMRDAEASSALRDTLHGFATWLAQLRKVLEEGLSFQAIGGKRLLHAALGHALSFAAWRALTEEQGLSDKEARDLMCRMIRTTVQDDQKSFS